MPPGGLEPPTHGLRRYVFDLTFVELAKPRCAALIHRQKVSIARFAAVTSSGAPRVAITVKRLTSPRGVRRSSETTGWVAGLAGGSSGR